MGAQIQSLSEALSNWNIDLRTSPSSAARQPPGVVVPRAIVRRCDASRLCLKFRFHTSHFPQPGGRADTELSIEIKDAHWIHRCRSWRYHSVHSPDAGGNPVRGRERKAYAG